MVMFTLLIVAMFVNISLAFVSFAGKQYKIGAMAILIALVCLVTAIGQAHNLALIAKVGAL